MSNLKNTVITTLSKYANTLSEEINIRDAKTIYNTALQDSLNITGFKGDFNEDKFEIKLSDNSKQNIPMENGELKFNNKTYIKFN